MARGKVAPFDGEDDIEEIELQEEVFKEVPLSSSSAAREEEGEGKNDPVEEEEEVRYHRIGAKVRVSATVLRAKIDNPIGRECDTTENSTVAQSCIISVGGPSTSRASSKRTNISSAWEENDNDPSGTGNPTTGTATSSGGSKDSSRRKSSTPQVRFDLREEYIPSASPEAPADDIPSTASEGSDGDDATSSATSSNETDKKVDKKVEKNAEQETEGTKAGETRTKEKAEETATEETAAERETSGETTAEETEEIAAEATAEKTAEKPAEDRGEKADEETAESLQDAEIAKNMFCPAVYPTRGCDSCGREVQIFRSGGGERVFYLCLSDMPQISSESALCNEFFRIFS